MPVVFGKNRTNRPYFFIDVNGNRVEVPSFSLGTGELEGNQLAEFKMYQRARQISDLEESGLGSELIVNGTFDTDLSGWSQSGTNYIWQDGAVTRESTGTGEYLYQSVNVETGKQYFLSCVLDSYTNNPRFYSPEDTSWFDISLVQMSEGGAVVTAATTGAVDVGFFNNSAQIVCSAVSMREIL